MDNRFKILLYILCPSGVIVMATSAFGPWPIVRSIIGYLMAISPILYLLWIGLFADILEERKLMAKRKWFDSDGKTDWPGYGLGPK